MIKAILQESSRIFSYTLYWLLQKLRRKALS